MKKTITTTEELDSVWVVFVDHPESMFARNFNGITLFENVEDARANMLKEYKHHITDCLKPKIEEIFNNEYSCLENKEKYHCDFKAFGKNGNLIEKLSINIYREDIN